MEKKRKELVIATKISGKGYKNVRNGKGIFPKEIRLAIEGSLENLQTDYIDLYQLHWPNRGSYHFRQYWNYDPTSQESSLERENIELVVKELYNLKKDPKQSTDLISKHPEIALKMRSHLDDWWNTVKDIANEGLSSGRYILTINPKQ